MVFAVFGEGCKKWEHSRCSGRARDGLACECVCHKPLLMSRPMPRAYKQASDEYYTGRLDMLRPPAYASDYEDDEPAT